MVVSLSKFLLDSTTLVKCVDRAHAPEPLESTFVGTRTVPTTRDAD